MSSPHRPAGLHVAACPTAHYAYPNHLPWLLGVLGGAGLQLGRKGLTGSLGEAEKRHRGGKMFRIVPTQSHGYFVTNTQDGLSKICANFQSGVN